MTSSKFTSRFILILSFFLQMLSFDCSSQYVTAYNDYLDHLMVFDRGLLRQIEYLKVTSYKIGGNSIAYIDNKNDFKIYYNGQTFPMLNAADFSYTVSDNLTSFRVDSVLYVFDAGQKKTLSYYSSRVSLNDSVLVYYDDTQATLNIYYNGGIAYVEDALIAEPKIIRTGSNLVAWINQSNIFNIFYHGNVYAIDNIPPLMIVPGRDILAYVDEYERKFRLFYFGETAIVDEYPPDSVKVGFGIMAYVDNLGNFRMFKDGSTKKILSDRPRFFYVQGNVIIYFYNNTFYGIYNGETTILQNARPVDFQLSNDGVAWIDDSGHLMLFHRGKISTVSYETVKKYYLNGEVLKYEVGVNTVNVFYNGKNY